jgi:hypothetical protein
MMAGLTAVRRFMLITLCLVCANGVSIAIRLLRLHNADSGILLVHNVSAWCSK